VGNANVRRGPTISAQVVTTVSMGTRLRVLGREGRWVKVEVVDRRGSTTTVGYIVDSLGTLTEISPPPPPEPPPAVVEAPPAPVVPEPLTARPLPVSSPRTREPGDLVPRQPAPVPLAETSRRNKAPGPGPLLGALGEGGVVAANGKLGAMIGGGGFVFLFGHDDIAIQGDAHFVQFDNAGSFYGSGNVIQYFHTPNLPFTPFAGAGVPIFKDADETRMGIQLIFGVDRFAIGRLALGAQIRTSFVSGGPITVILAHVSFRSGLPASGSGE